MERAAWRHAEARRRARSKANSWRERNAKLVHNYGEIEIAADAIYYGINVLLDVLRNGLPYEDAAEDLFWKNNTLWELRLYVKQELEES